MNTVRLLCYCCLVLLCICEPSITDPHLKEWIALNTLTKVESAKTLYNRFCMPDETKTWDSSDKKESEIPKRQPFVQSEYLPSEININIFEQMCRISLGKTPSLEPYTNHDFQLIHNANGKCLDDHPVDVLLLIDSGMANYEQRDAIRRTWANGACWLGARVRHVFLLETTRDVLLPDPGIMEEQDLYNDVIQQHFTMDTENSSSYKLLLGFQWSLAYCAQAKWLLFVNEEQFVNPLNVISFLLSISEAMRQRLVVGSVWYEPRGSEVEKLLFKTNQKSKSGKRYPTFVATSGMFVSSVLSPIIYLTMRYTELSRHPDLFMANVLSKLFILPAHFDDIYAHNRKPKESLRYDRAILFPGGGKENQTELWNALKCHKYCQ